MGTGSGWAPAGPARYGLVSQGPASNATTELTSIASPADGASNELALWHPANPMFWVAAIGALTFGLMAASTTVRVGKAKATVSVGS